MLQVDFAAPVGYKEPEPVKRPGADDDEEDMVNHQQSHYEANNFVTFSGEGNRLDGKKKKCDKVEPVQATVVRIFFGLSSAQAEREKIECFSRHFLQTYTRGIPDYDHPYGLIRFDRSVKPIDEIKKAAEDAAGKPDDEFKTFQGAGFTLRKGKK